MVISLRIAKRGSSPPAKLGGQMMGDWNSPAPGGLIFIFDESPEGIRVHYQKQNPFTRKACAGITTNFDPRDWIPSGARDLHYEVLLKNKGYLMRFHAPADRTAG